MTAGRPTRRRFLGWSASFGGAAWLGAGVGATGCGSSGAGSPADRTTLRWPKQLSLVAAPRKVQWVPGKSPRQANAWVYAQQSAASADAVLPHHLGPTIEVRRGEALTVTWTNGVPAYGAGALLMADPPIHPPTQAEFCGQVRLQSSVGLVTHLHGARVQGSSDGWPLAPLGFAGNPYGFPQTRVYTYPNQQRATLLWYHDHALDRTGPNVHAGLVGMYLIRDAADDALMALAGGASQELRWLIQDRNLTPEQDGIDYAAGMITDAANDDGNRPEFLGSTLFVNGHPSASLDLQARAWRLRLLNGCNTRAVALAVCDLDALQAGKGRVWYTDRLRLIGTDGGLISRSLPLAATEALVLGPGQRRDALLDLSTLPGTVRRLRIVNLVLQPLLGMSPGSPEAIYTTDEDSLALPTDASYSAADQTLYALLKAEPLARVLDLNLSSSAAAGVEPVPLPQLDALLAQAASDDDFRWDGQQLQPLPGRVLGPNRLVLLMSNTQGFSSTEPGHGVTGWGDVQIFEMTRGPSDGGASADWQLPFDVDLATAINPSAGQPSGAQRGYTLGRRSFFAQRSNPDITVAKAYPTLHPPVVRANGGTYERWYVANIGNAQPLNKASGDPDMHPFHIHLVNFVVTRRWQLGDGDEGHFEPLAPAPLDGIARQDTVLIPSGQLVELWVYYPPGYRGDFAFHCHLLEHEDMCMMSHFRVD